MNISDDDGHYWLTYDGMCMSAGHVDSIQKVSTIMKNWLEANCTPGYYKGHEGEAGWECSYRELKPKPSFQKVFKNTMDNLL